MIEVTLTQYRLIGYFISCLYNCSKDEIQNLMKKFSREAISYKLEVQLCCFAVYQHFKLSFLDFNDTTQNLKIFINLCHWVCHLLNIFVVNVAKLQQHYFLLDLGQWYSTNVRQIKQSLICFSRRIAFYYLSHSLTKNN